MDEHFDINGFFSLIGRFGEISLIDIIREFNISLLSRGFQEIEFKTLIHKLAIAEKRGISKKERLQQEIDEWATLLDDDKKSRLYTMGNSSVIEVFSSVTNDKETGMVELLKNLKDDITDLEDEVDEEATIFISELDNVILNLKNPQYFESISESISPEIQLLQEKSLEEMTVTEFFKVISAHTRFPDEFIKVIKKVAKEILLAHSQMDYFQKIIDYKYELYPEEDLEEELSSKKISIALPKVERSANDKITSLTLDQTTYLFSLLREQGIILKEKNYQSASNIALAIKILTGYNDQNVRAKLDKNDDINRFDKNVVQGKIKKINDLITKELN